MSDWIDEALENVIADAAHWKDQDWRTRDVWKTIDTIARVLVEMNERAKHGE